MADFTVNENSSIYYGNTYWNDLPEVIAWLNRKVSGNPANYWGKHVAATVGRTFKRGLVLNCGNGNVEHGLFDNGVVEEVVGIDYSEELLEQARGAAKARGDAARYQQLDTNTAAFPDEEFDLVVNHAAAHHIAYIDRVFRALCRMLSEDSWFLSWDYVGPHRNQYGWAAWDAAAIVNRSLPERFRQEMEYPHLPTMLADDPTEAIHSELILATMRRYFHLDELLPLGGAIAYPLLTHNQRMFAAGADDPDRSHAIETILAADEAYTAGEANKSLFVYVVARPNKAALDDVEQLETWTAEEDARETAAQANGGEYYERTTLQELMLSREDSRVAALHSRERAEDLATKLDDLTAAYEQLQARNTELQTQADFAASQYDELQARYNKVMSMPPYQQIRWFARTGVGERLRRDERIAKLKHKLSSR